jgi:hypothetical protein
MTLSEYEMDMTDRSSRIKWLLSIVCNRLGACNPQTHQARNLRGGTFVTCTPKIHQARSLRGGTLMTSTAQIHQAWSLRGRTLMTCTAQIHQARSLRGEMLVTFNEQVSGSDLGRSINWPEGTFSRYTLATPSKYWDSILNYTMTASFHIPYNALFTVTWSFYAT